MRLDDRIVGRLDLVAGEIETPDGTVPLASGARPFRSRPPIGAVGLGATLLRTSERYSRREPRPAPPSRMSRPLYARLGYFDLSLQRHVLIRRTGPLLEPRLGTGALGRTASRGG